MARIRFKLEFVAEVPDGLRSLPKDPLAVVIDGVRSHAVSIEAGARIRYTIARPLPKAKAKRKAAP